MSASAAAKRNGGIKRQHNQWRKAALKEAA